MATLARHIQIEVAKINSQIGWRYHQLLCHATVKFKPFTKVKYQQVLASVL
jgi:polysaccharide pyruvyl transferase WcaK-like protein